MSGLMILSIAFGLAGIQLTIVGAFIFKGNVEILAGYDPNKVKNKEGLGKYAGSRLMLAGLAIIFSVVTANLVASIVESKTGVINSLVLGFIGIVATIVISIYAIRSWRKRNLKET